MPSCASMLLINNFRRRFSTQLHKSVAAFEKAWPPRCKVPLHSPPFSPCISFLSADLELKSHKAQVPFLDAASFQLHLSSLISILMVYSCRFAHAVFRCVETCMYNYVCVYRCVYVCTHARTRTHGCYPDLGESSS